MNTIQIIPTVIDKLRATGVLTSNETNPTDADTVKIGAITYRFKTTMAQAYDVKLHASDADITLANLVAAINGTGTAGTEYFAGTVAHTLVTAGAVTAHATTLTAVNIGYVANSIVTTTPVGTTLSWGAVTMVGGVGGQLDGVAINGDANYVSFIYNGEGKIIWQQQYL